MINMIVYFLKLRILNAKFLVAVFIGSIPFCLDTIKLISYADYINEPLNLFDGIIYSTSNLFSMGLAVLGAFVILFSSNIIDTQSIYFLFRSSKKKWLISELAVIFATSIIYYLSIFVINILMLIKYAFLSDVWSEALYTLGYSNPDLGSNMFNLGFSSPVVMQYTTPFFATVTGFVTSTLYISILSIILMGVSIKFNKAVGSFIVLTVHISGYILSMRFGMSSWGKLSFLGNSLLNENYFSNGLYVLCISCCSLLIIIFVFISTSFALPKYDMVAKTGDSDG